MARYNLVEDCVGMANEVVEHLAWQTRVIWGISTAGSALGLQPRGQEFEPPILHQ